MSTHASIARSCCLYGTLLLSLLLVAACNKGAGAAPATPKNSVTISLNGDIRSTDPGVNRDSNTDTVMMHIVEGLVGYRENGEVAPLLAQTVALSDGGKTYTFNLRHDVHFHNGAALTSADVIWSWRRYLDPKTNWTCLSDFDGSHGTRIESISAPDSYTVVFRLNRPDPLLLTQMAALPCGGSGILSPSSVHPDGSWNKPVGTGPYMLGRWRRGQYVDLIAFPGYVSPKGPRDGYTGEKRAYVHRLRWLIIHDDASRRAALIKGQLDVMPELTGPDINALKQDHNIVLYRAPSLITYVILIQSNDPLLSDVRVRRALAYSLNTRIIAKLSTAGTGAANSSMVPKASPWYSAAQAGGYPTNPQLARQLLAEAGYHGQPIVLLTNRRYPSMFDQALMVQSMARKVGINIKLQILEWATQLDRYENGDYQLMSFAYTARADPYLSYNLILGNRKKDKRKIWNDATAINLLRQSGRTGNAVERQQLFDQLHALMIRDVPLIVLYNPADVNAVNRSLTGFESWPMGHARLWGVKRLNEESKLLPFSAPTGH